MRNFLLSIATLSITVLFAMPLNNNLIAAFKSGNSNVVAKYFSNSVDFSLPNKEGLYSKAQAELVLKNFFSKNKPIDFKVAHNGSSKENSEYTIASLITEEATFRVYILYNQKANNTEIVELRIELDE